VVKCSGFELLKEERMKKREQIQQGAHALRLAELNWQDVRDIVQKSNPGLAQIIDQLKPGNELTLFKARYSFGQRILNRGVLHLPTETGKTIPLSDPAVPDIIRKKLNYSSVPVTLILTKTVEVFFETEERVMPSKLFATGTTFGLWEAFDPAPPEFVKKVWNLSAGARTSFLLPKISDAASHARLRRDWAIHAYPPKTLLDHIHVFSEIARQPEETGENWYCDVLFFCAPWLEKQEDNLKHLKLHKYWLDEAWRQSYNCRTQMSYDVAWESFSKEVTRRNWKPKPYIINTIKHLMAIGEGIFPGFAPSCGKNDAAPEKLIQKAYCSSYLLRDQAPIIMQPHHLREANTSVYYSLAVPTLLEYAPRPRNAPSIISDIRELRMLMRILQESLSGNTVSYDFFHTEPDRYGEIRPAKTIFGEDKQFSQSTASANQENFPETSPFFRGCVRITLNHKN
jgi:hypothetical protein